MIGTLERMNELEFEQMVDEVFKHRRGGENDAKEKKKKLAEALKTGDETKIVRAQKELDEVQSKADGDRVDIIKGVLKEFWAKHGAKKG